MCASLALFAIPDETDIRDPIARAVAREVSRLAIAPQGTVDDTGWSAVLALARGAEVIVTVRGSQRMKRYVAHSDAPTLVLSRTSDGALEQAARPILQSTHPLNVIDKIPRTDITQVAIEVTERTKGKAVAGALVGFASAVALDVWLARHVSCSVADEQGCSLTLLFGLPALFTVGGAVAGYYAFGTTTVHVIYRAP
jgi:hypothetical protein